MLLENLLNVENNASHETSTNYSKVVLRPPLTDQNFPLKILNDILFVIIMSH